MKFTDFYEKSRPTFEEYLLTEALQAEKGNKQVSEAMNYSLEAGGKRLRPLLLLAVLQSFQQDIQAGYRAAAAVELIHTYSLVHDDLPAMDDDDMRRGKPANHKVYGEATAILAGDALLTRAFELLAEETETDSQIVLELIRLLSEAAGYKGMIAGQQEDMEAEGRSITLEEIRSIHQKKTAALLEYSFVAGGLLSGASQEMLDLLKELSEKLGVAYQIRDDIWDVIGDEETLGKPVGSDIEQGKSTYPGILGLEGAKEMLQNELKEAVKLVEQLDQLSEQTQKPFDKELLVTFVHSMQLEE